MSKLIVGQKNILVVDVPKIRHGFNVVIEDAQLLSEEFTVEGLTTYHLLTNTTLTVVVEGYEFPVKVRSYEEKTFNDLTDTEIAANIGARNYDALRKHFVYNRPGFLRRDKVVLIGFDLCQDITSTMNGAY